MGADRHRTCSGRWSAGPQGAGRYLGDSLFDKMALQGEMAASAIKLRPFRLPEIEMKFAGSFFARNNWR